MADLDVKVSPPKWDSNKRVEWPTFATDFESFVEYCNGEELVELIHLAIHSRSQDVLPNQSVISQSLTSQSPGEDEQHPDFASRFDSLKANMRKLDAKLYHILKLNVKGPSHDIIVHSQKSFVQAFIMLYTEHGATNMLRKTGLISKLFGQLFKGDINKFKQEFLQLIQDVLRSNITIQDIIIQCILNSLQGEQYQAFKLVISKDLDDQDDPNPYDVLNSICSSLESSKDQSNTSVVRNVHKHCTRCRRNNHDVNHCRATTDVDGNLLQGKGKGTKGNKRNNKGKGKGDRNAISDQPVTDHKSSGKQTLSDVLSGLKANKTSLSLEEVKEAIQNASCLHISHATSANAATDQPVSGNTTQERAQEEQALLSNHVQSLYDLSMDMRASAIDSIIDSLEDICSNTVTDQPVTDNSSTSLRTRVLDSGSPEHIFSNIDVTDTSNRVNISGFDGAKPQRSNGSGNTTISTMGSHNEAIDISLSKVQNVDGIPDDIVSLHRLVSEHGYSFHAYPDIAYLQPVSDQPVSDQPVSPESAPEGAIPIATQNGCYVFDEVGNTTHYVKSNQRKETWLGLHKRLNHASKEVMINTLNNTYGIQLTSKGLDDFFCPTCAIANSSRKGTSMLRNPDLKATRVGERVFCDLKTFKQPTRQGFKHYIIYVDEFSDWIAIFPLKTKGEAVTTLRGFKHELLSHSSVFPVIDQPVSASDQPVSDRAVSQTMTLRPDGDPSCFDNSAFKQECEKLHILIDFTPPYTPQHNRAERAIEAIDYKARVSLIDAPHLDFNDHYYDASASATYLHNRLVGSKGKTPYEWLKHQQPMISHIVPFGCKGVAHIHKESGRRGTSNGRGEPVYNIGYRTPFSHQYKYIAEDRKSVRHSIHVDWDLSNHGLENALSSDHLQAILEEANLGSVSQLMAISNSNNKAHEAIDDILAVVYGNPATDQPVTDQPVSAYQQNDEEAQQQQGLNPSEIEQILNNQPQVVINPINTDFKDGFLQSSQSTDQPVTGSDQLVNPDDVDVNNIIEGKRERTSTQHLNVDSFHTITHEIAALEAQIDAITHLVREIPLQEAIGGQDRVQWLEAFNKEIDSILKHTAIHISEEEEEYATAVKEATPSRIIANEKRDGRKKCRWVVQGCFESFDLDDWTNYAHVATLDSVRSMVFRRDRHKRTLASIDIKTAFLQSIPYGPNEKPRYIKLKDPNTGKMLYFRLITPMYGQRSAPRRWEDTLAPWLESQGFTRGKNEPSVFYRPSDDMSILVYVDDLLVDGDDASVRHFFTQLANEFDCNDPVFLSQGSPIDFIGIIISLSDQPVTKIQMSMEPYCEKLLSQMGMSSCTPREVPFRDNINYTSLALNEERASKYRSGVGGIGWLANTIRCDLAYTFSRLGSHLAAPTESTMSALMQALRYIQGTKHYKLSMELHTSDQPITDQLVNHYHLFVDSDHGSNTDPKAKRKSQTGYINKQNGVPVKWKSQTQSITTTSSAESEIYAASVATQNFMHHSYVLSELGLQDFPKPFPLHIDNAACITFMDDSTRVTRLKHIDLRENWVKQMRDQGVVIPTKVGTDDNDADILTKGLAAPKLKHFCNKLFDTSTD